MDRKNWREVFLYIYIEILNFFLEQMGIINFLGAHFLFMYIKLWKRLRGIHAWPHNDERNSTVSLASLLAMFVMHMLYCIYMTIFQGSSEIKSANACPWLKHNLLILCLKLRVQRQNFLGNIIRHQKIFSWMLALCSHFIH